MVVLGKAPDGRVEREFKDLADLVNNLVVYKGSCQRLALSS